MKKGIIGAGGFGREVYWSLSLMERVNTKFFIDDVYWDGNDDLILPLSKFDPNEYEVVIAVGDPKDRFDISQRLPKQTKYFTHIHQNVYMSIYTCICMYTHIYTYIHIYTYVHTNNIYIYIYICKCIYEYVYNLSIYLSPAAVVLLPEEPVEEDISMH